MILKSRQFGLSLKNIKKTVILPLTLLSLSLSPMIATATSSLSGSTTEQQNVQKESKTNSQDQEKELYLIIQSAHKAVIEKNDASQPGTFKIILHGVPPYATAFTQRPVRKVELITLEELLNLWKNSDPNGFTKNPPNAAINALVADSDSQEHVNFFVQLLEPVYNAKQRTLTYILKPLEGNPTAIPDSVTLRHVNLFIDDICLNCWWP